MAYKCDRCNHFTADGQKHNCINDLYDKHVAQVDMLLNLSDELKADNDKLRADLEVAARALNSIIAMSHSWVITETTGRIEKPIHDSYREKAREALAKIGGEK